MRMQGRAARAVIVVGFVVGAAVGCTGTPGAPTTPTSPVSATPTPSPTLTEPSPVPSPTSDVTTPPERPAAMSEATADGAAAAASYFMRLFPYVFATGDFAEWDALSDDGCQYCQNTRGSVEDQIARGMVGAGSEITVESAVGTEIVPGQSFSADLVVTQAPSFEVAADGRRTPDGDGGRYQLHVALTWSSEWRIVAVDASRV